MEDPTLEVLHWARDRAESCETTQTFWSKLCKAVKQDPNAEANLVLRELRLDGSNTLLRPFRDEPVPYAEVAYDVAHALSPLRGWGGFTPEPRKGDVDACERFVLHRMDISTDDLEALCQAISDKGWEQTFTSESAKLGGAAGTRFLGEKVAAEVGKRLAQKAAQEAGKRAGQKVAEQTAKSVVSRILMGLNLALAAYTVVDLAGPALRKTIPGVTYIALLRKLHLRAEMGV